MPPSQLPRPPTSATQYPPAPVILPFTPLATHLTSLHCPSLFQLPLRISVAYSLAASLFVPELARRCLEAGRGAGHPESQRQARVLSIQCDGHIRGHTCRDQKTQWWGGGRKVPLNWVSSICPSGTSSSSSTFSLQVGSSSQASPTGRDQRAPALPAPGSPCWAATGWLGCFPPQKVPSRSSLSL